MAWKNPKVPQKDEYYWCANFVYSSYTKRTIFDSIYARRRIWKDQADDYALLASGNCFEKKNNAEIYGAKVLKEIRRQYKEALS